MRYSLATGASFFDSMLIKPNDLYVALYNAKAALIKYLVRLHTRKGHERRGAFERWKNNRPLLKTGDLKRGYRGVITGVTTRNARLGIYNEMHYSQYLNGDYPHVYFNDKMRQMVNDAVAKMVLNKMK